MTHEPDRFGSRARARSAAAALQWWVLLFLFAVPLALIALKGSQLPVAGELARALSLGDVPAELHNRVRYILFLPLGAVVVVFFRVTLGIRVLGPFRSILLAVAFQVAGLALGLIFLVLVVGAVVAVRPLLKAVRLPYFGRVSVTLSTVAALMLVALRASQWLELEALLRVAYFPVVVLCLTGDGFARVWYREGLPSAAWRGGMTAVAAVSITGLSEIPGFATTLLRYPEMLVLEIGLVMLISEFLGFRLLAGLNPAPLSRGAREGRPGLHGPMGASGSAARTELSSPTLRGSEG